MSEKSFIILKVLLNRYHGEATENFLQPLSDDDKEKILNLSINSSDISPILSTSFDSFKHVHYSWFIAPLQEMEKSKTPLFLSLVPEPQREKLCQMIDTPPTQSQFSPPIKKFLKGQLSGSLKFKDVLPLQYLPKTELAPLAERDKNELIEIIDFLGLYDLAEEVHQIVDKTILEKIYGCLTKKKQMFLRKCLHQKERLVTQRLGLEKWDGESKKLFKLLHHKGMVRLGYALSGQHPDFIWHITHILDTGRGTKLKGYISDDQIPGVTPTLKKQLIKLLLFFKKGAAS